MSDRFILTPLFLDEVDEGLKALLRPSWRMVQPDMPNGDTQQRIASVHGHLAKAVADTISRGNRPVSIAGDCCTTLGVLAGLQQSEIAPTLLWIDAHGDLNTWETSPSGFLGGMPLAMILGLGEQTIMESLGVKPLETDRIMLTDGRDLDLGESDLIESLDLQHVPKITDLLETPAPEGPLYVHFDSDILDPADAPAMGYLAPGGPSLADMGRVFKHLAQTYNIVAVSMSTWRPKMDEDGSSEKVCMRLLKDLLASA
jgi:arginase